MSFNTNLQQHLKWKDFKTDLTSGEGVQWLKMFMEQFDTFLSFLLQEMLYYLKVHCGSNIL